MHSKFSAAARMLYAASFASSACTVCGQPAAGMPLCSRCARELRPVSNTGPVCSVCGKPLLSEQEKCMECRESPVLTQVSSVSALFPYRLWYKQLLFAWKMQDMRSLSPLFARCAALRLNAMYQEKPVPPLVPVPPRPGKIREKGWDQVQELCALLHKLYGFTVISPLERLTRSQQKKLGRSERLGEKGASFSLKKPFLGQNRLPGHLILVDDVMTTGATAQSCACVLRQGGCTKIDVLTLFIVD